MKTTLSQASKRPGALVSGRLLLAAALLSSCGTSGGGGSGDVLARGDRFEVTVPELDQVLRAAPRVAAEQVAPARRALLQQIVDEKLFAEAAVDAGLDRDVRTMQAIEAARRAILARAYAEKVAADAPRPSLAEITAARAGGAAGPVRALTVEEVTIPVATAGMSDLQGAFDKGGLDALSSRLEQAGVAATRGTTRLAAGDLPDVPADRLAALKPGAKVRFQTGDVAHFGRVAAVERAAVSAEAARSEIGERLLAERKAARIRQEIARLRAQRKVTVVDPSTSRSLRQSE